MSLVLIGPNASVDDNEFDDVDRELTRSAREVSCGCIPFANLDFTKAAKAARLEQCPECGGENLIPVFAGQDTNCFCEDCTSCWHREAGQVTRVNPWTCPGCQLWSAACFERFDLSSTWTEAARPVAARM